MALRPKKSRFRSCRPSPHPKNCPFWGYFTLFLLKSGPEKVDVGFSGQMITACSLKNAPGSCHRVIFQILGVLQEKKKAEKGGGNRQTDA